MVFDRGLQSRSTFCELDDNHIGFVCRMKGKVKHRIVEVNPIGEKQDENLVIETDHWVYPGGEPLYAKGKRI